MKGIFHGRPHAQSRSVCGCRLLRPPVSESGFSIPGVVLLSEDGSPRAFSFILIVTGRRSDAPKKIRARLRFDNHVIDSVGRQGTTSIWLFFSLSLSLVLHELCISYFPRRQTLKAHMCYLHSCHLHKWFKM